MRRHDPPQRSREDREAGERRSPEPAAELSILELQRTAGNRAVSALLARQPAPTDSRPTPSRDRAATSTVGLGDEIGVIPLDSASLGQPDRNGSVHDLHVTFLNNPAVPAIQAAMLGGRPIPQGFYSSSSMKLELESIVITSMTFADDHEGDEIVALSLNFNAAKLQPAP